VALERLDKLLSSTGHWSRKEVKDMVRQGRILADGIPVKKPEEKFDPAAVTIAVDGQPVNCVPFVYLMMDKPGGLLSATEDRKQKTVLDLLPQHLQKRGLFPVGRLDKDTTGLLLLTDDGALAHDLLSPKKHVDKVYLARVTGNPSNEAIDRLRRGVYMEGDQRKTYPADVRVVRDESLFSDIVVTIHEGRNRQVRRMFDAVGHKVLLLRRIRFGAVELGSLRRGEWRELTQEEIDALHAL